MRFIQLCTAVFGWRVRGGPFRGMRYAGDLPAALRLPALVFGRGRFVNALNEQRPGLMRWFLCDPREATA